MDITASPRIEPQTLFHSRVLFDFLKSPCFVRAFSASNLAKTQAKVDHYKHFFQAKIQSLEFQERAIADACRKSSGLWCGELWTGAGKSIIAARIALKYLARGKKVIFICPNRMGIGSVADGIIQKFHRVFEHYKASYRIGSLDAVTLLDDVHFFTPHAFVRMAREGGALFKKLISEAGLLIVDEAHHFPEDPKDDQVIYGKIEKLASKYFLSTQKKVVTLTATHGRHDGKPVFRKERPDFQITVNEAVQAGWCPEIHGLPVYLDVKAPRAAKIGGEFYLNLKGKQLLTYLRKVAAVMLQVQKANPGQQFCAFVRTIREAKKLQEIWNFEAKNLGFPPVALLIGTMPGAERIKVKQAIQNREYAGYITCDVGSESIDIPRMETVHLIRRTMSINRLVQSIGRVLRNHPEKRRALVVDYNLAERRIIRACQGLEAYAHYVKSSAKRLVSGGPLIPITGTPNADFSGISIGEERSWIESTLRPGGITKGRVFGWLTVLRDDHYSALCRCKCGKEMVFRRRLLLNGMRLSCGCYRHSKSALKPNTRFGKLIVTKYVNSASVHCKCACGKTIISQKAPLVYGTRTSCGCDRPYFGALRKGRRFGKLKVLRDEGPERVICKCDCGKKAIVSRRRLRKETRCCGCSVYSRRTKALRRGARFGRLKVLEDRDYTRVLCICDCGKKCSYPRIILRRKISCGCISLGRSEKLAQNHIRKTEIRNNRLYIKKGSVFAWLTVLEDRGCTQVKCQCRCGKTTTYTRRAVLNGLSKSCGCRKTGVSLPAGKVIPNLTVLSDEGFLKVKCRCVCGITVIRSRTVLRSAGRKSCGCLRRGNVLKKGSVFGILQVLRDEGIRKVFCRCACGKKLVCNRSCLRTGKTYSCGCVRRSSRIKRRP